MANSSALESLAAEFPAEALRSTMMFIPRGEYEEFAGAGGSKKEKLQSGAGDYFLPSAGLLSAGQSQSGENG